jgi:uncharacterized GH25 family protein
MHNVPTSRGLASAAMLLLSIGSAQAHSPYLLPNLFDVGKRDHVTVQASFTEEFFEPDVVMKSEDYHVIAPDGSKQPLTPVYAKDLAILEAPTAAEGTYRISTGRRTGRTAKAAWVDGDWKFLGREESPPAGSKGYDVTSITIADVYVTRGKPSDKALAPSNSGFEFRAISHPSSLFIGSEAKFVVLLDGKPLAKHPVSIYSGQQRYSDKKVFAEVTTDASGQFSVKPDKPGPYLALSRYRPTPKADSAQGVSYTYSLVFEATD